MSLQLSKTKSLKSSFISSFISLIFTDSCTTIF